jgi:hypothetical protein
MNDSKFIELLNLFLDHEITIADAKLLEAEVQRNPARRRIYREYCEMQKACLVLAEQSETTAVTVDFKASENESRDSFWNVGSWGVGTYAAGFCAAAACLALAVVIRNGNASISAAPHVADPAAIAIVQIDPATTHSQARREVPMTVSLSPRSSELHPVFTTQSLALSKQQRDTTPSISVDPRFDWMNRVQVASLQKVNADELIFEAKASLQTETNTFRSRRAIESQFDRAAFQFQR